MRRALDGGESVMKQVDHSRIPRCAQTEQSPWSYVGSGERLTLAEEQELARRAQRGDAAARERLLQANVGLVVGLARKVVGRSLDAEDLVQEGMIGLCDAVDRFDSDRGLRFSTYATYWIRQRLLRAANRQGRLVRLPDDVANGDSRAAAARLRLLEELGREPTVPELAAACGISEKRLRGILAATEEPLPLDASLAAERGGLALELPDPDAPDPERTVLEREQAAELRRALAALPARDRHVLEVRFGLGGPEVPAAELAGQLRVTAEAVRQAQRRALLKLRRLWAVAP